MKKFILMFAVLLGLASCSSCGNGDKKGADSKQLAANNGINVESIISTDKEDMYLNYKEDYRWFETQMVLKDFLDDEKCDGTVEKVSNVFQVVEGDEKCMDVHVIMYNHTSGVDTTDVEVIHSFWIEDDPLNSEPIKITYKEAFKRLMEANIAKPHSRHCILRKEIGPKDCNPQYIFGNTHETVFVDAVTGKVSGKNPAFDGGDFGKPLGEWP